MYIESVKNVQLKTQGGNFDIVELKVRGNEDVLEEFRQDISGNFSVAHDEWVSNLNMLVLTFDKIPKEQTMNRIKSYTKEWIEWRA